MKKKKTNWFLLILTGGLLGLGAYTFKKKTEKKYLPVEGRKNF